ncbi:MAG: AMP-binding protein [Bacteroidota bacterium]
MKRLFDLIYHQRDTKPLDASISGRDASGQWKSYSTKDVIEASERAAAGLLKLGIKPGDKIAIVAYKNRPEWLIMDFATQMIGVINVPLYPTISSSEYEYILTESEVKVAFCGRGDLFDKLSVAQNNLPALQNIYTFDQQEGRPFWEDIFTTDNLDEVEKIKESIKGVDLATIIYTSGTTGNPKGVMLTHDNIMHVVKNTEPHLKANPGDKVLSFLPLCHIFERAVSMTYTYKGVSTYFTGTDNLAGPEGDLLDVRPVVITTVPRLLEKIYEAIYNKGLALDGIKKKLFFWALSLTDDYDLNKSHSFPDSLKWKIADKLIFSKWRDALGGNLNMIVTGAAPCPVKIMRVFCAAGINVREGYGLTETSPTLTVNTLDDDGALLGTVGPMIDGVDIMIDPSEGEYHEEEGEILAFGPNVTSGYYKKPEINAEIFKDIDGKTWFRTGDVGKLVTFGPKANISPSSS